VKYAQVPFALQLFCNPRNWGLPGAQTAISALASVPELDRNLRSEKSVRIRSESVKIRASQDPPDTAATRVAGHSLLASHKGLEPARQG
jgi:hypothetical protein